MTPRRTSSLALATVSNRDAIDDESPRRAPALPSNRQSANAGVDAAQKLVSILLEQIEDADDPDRRVELLHQVASIHEERLGEPERAFDAMLVAWSDDYANEVTAEALTRLAPQLQGWAELLTLANDALQQDLEPRKRLAVCLRCASWCGDHLGRPDSAIAYYQEALAIDPSQLSVTLRLATQLEAVEQWDAVLGILEHALRLSTENKERVGLHLRVAALCEGRVNHPVKAEASYRHALEIDASNRQAAEALERIYRRDQRWDDLVGLLRKAASTTRDPKAASSLWLKLAEIWQGPLDAPAEAIAAYEQVIAGDSLNLSALRGLEVLYRATERWQGLPAVLEGLARAVESDRERIEVLTRLAALWEQTFVKPDKAIACLEQARAIDRGHHLVLQNLVRLYRHAKRWNDLLAALDDTLAATSDPAAAVATHKEIAALCTTDIQDLQRAIRAYEQVHAADSGDIEALRGLIRLYERTDDAKAAVASMERLARLEDDEDKRAELLLRMGELYQRKLMDPEAALARYERAAALQPKRGEILRTLREAQVEARDFRAASLTLRSEIAAARSPRALSDLNLQLAQMLTEHLHDSEKAVEHLEAACAHDAANLHAALALALVHVRKLQWEKALPLLQRIVKRSHTASQPPGRAGSSEPEAGLTLSARKQAAYLLGEVAGRCDQHALSAQGYEQALALDARDLRSALGAASAYFREENWPQTEQAYQRVLSDWRAELDDEARAQAFRRLGLALLAQGNQRKALGALESALKASPADVQSLRALVTLHQNAKEWKKAVRYKTLLAAQLPEDERARMHCEAAAMLRDKLDSPRKAAAALRSALERAPSNRALLHELLSLHQHTRRWHDAISVIEKIAEVEPRAEVSSKYVYTAGVIARDELRDSHAAVDFFERALDLAPSHLKAFEAINSVLTREKNWKQLERAFRKMLHRLAANSISDPELLHQIWHGLGVIYRDRLGDLVAAAQAFEQARRLKPDSDTQHCILAELYERIPGEIQRAVSEHTLRIEQDPSSPAPYLALYDIYTRHRANDRAWCVASTLIYLKAADREQRAFHERFDGMPRFNDRGLTSEDWLRHLYHPDHDRALATIFRCLAGPLHERRFAGKAPAGSARGAKERMDVSEALTATFQSALQVLSPDVRPRLIANPAAPHGLRSEVGLLPTTIAGRVVCAGRETSGLRFLVGHHVAYHRSEHYLRKLLPARQELGAAFMVAMRSIGKSDGSRGTEKAWADLSRGLAPEIIERIQKAARIFAERGEPADLKRFVQTAELTACRAGLLMANDLAGSIAMVQHLESAGADDVSPTEKCAALLKFSVSEDYFQLRRQIGIAVA